MGGPGRLERLSRAAAALRQSVLESAAETPVELRRAAFDDAVADPVVAGYVTLVDQHAYRVTDATLTQLRSTGWSDDAIFELTAAAALGAAQRRFDSAMSLVIRNTDS